MPKKPEPGSRAAKLRKTIGELDTGTGAPGSDAPAKGGGEKRPLSPRDFIQKRMAELEKKKK